MPESPGKLKLGALVALVVGSMIGGGICSLPQNMAASADVGAVLISWAITAVGMLTLAFVFQTQANRKPELDGGVYAYAKAGFGDYMGFPSAWRYWISAWLGNVGYFVLLFSTLGYFFPLFGEGNTVAAIIAASVLLWAVHLLVLRGIKEAAFINLVTTVAKVVPLLLFVLIVIGARAVIYAIWLIYAGGVKYLLLCALLYAPDVILFAEAKLGVNKPVFTNVEKLIFAAVVVGAVVAAYGLYDGFLTL